jgi:plastocyanin
MTIRRIGVAFLLAFFVPALALAAQVSVSLGTNSISPSTININAGDTVVWNNVSSMNQSVIADNDTFQSGFIAPGGQFAATFNQAGEYNYYDNAQGSAVLGEVIVNGTSVTTSTVAPTQTYVNPNVNYSTTQTSSSSSQAAALSAEVQQLIAEINAIEGGSSVSTTGYGSVSGAPAYTAGSCPQIGRVLSLGTSGSDVTSLQQFLGISPATGYYGTITQAQVEQWQAANSIISYGTPATTGYGVVGPRTAAAIRLACTNGSVGTGTDSAGSGSGSGVVSGFLQVSPSSGSAPLPVTVDATVNVAQSCTGATYQLNYGDNTQAQQIVTNSGNCSPQNQQFQHTYQYGGTYTMTLSSGGQQSTATVTVSGPPAPGSGSTSQAAGSISAFVVSGAAPLSTTFYVSCASGLAYDVVFGDGQDLGGSNVAQTNCTGGLQAITHTYSTAGTYNAQLVIFIKNSNGTVTPEAVGNQSITAIGTSTNNSPGSTSTTYPPPSLTPNVSGNPLEASLQFQIGACTSYTIQWGDGQSAPGTGPCGGSGNTTQTVTHTYAQSGPYVVTLLRGSQTDTVGVSISN